MANQMLSTSPKKFAIKREWIAGYLFLLPSFLGFFIFIAVPIVMGFVISFTNYNGMSAMEFVGISNYTAMFSDMYFTTSLVNNIVYTVVTVPAVIFLALLLAVALNSGVKGVALFKTMYYFPSISSMAIVGIVWALLYAPTGPINQMLSALGMENTPKWLLSTDTALLSVMIVAVWKQIGYYMIMILAGLQTIPKTLYEAAEIDGANGFRKFWSITVPMLSPTMFMVSVLSVIASFQVFDLVAVMTEGGPGRSTNVLVYRIYQEAFVNSKFGYASAMSYFLFAVVMVITLIRFRVERQKEDDVE